MGKKDYNIIESTDNRFKFEYGDVGQNAPCKFVAFLLCTFLSIGILYAAPPNGVSVLAFGLILLPLPFVMIRRKNLVEVDVDEQAVKIVKYTNFPNKKTTWIPFQSILSVHEGEHEKIGPFPESRFVELVLASFNQNFIIFETTFDEKPGCSFINQRFRELINKRVPGGKPGIQPNVPAYIM